MLQIVTIWDRISQKERKTILMKKTLITILILMASLIGLRADASLVIMDYQGDTIVRPYGAERTLVVNSNDGGEYDIAIRPYDDALTSSDGQVRIPLQYVYINNNREDVYMRYNDYSTVFRRAVMGGIAKTMVLKVRGYGMIPAGVYNLNIEVQAVDSDTQEVAGTTTFNLQLIIPTTQDLSFHGESANINVGPSNAFARNKKIPTETNPILTINSNCDWILTLNTDNFGETTGRNYYIRTVSGSSEIGERLQERVLIEPYKEIMIARGKAPANNQYVSIEVSVEGKDGDIIRAGEYYNNLKFKLGEDRR